MGSLFFPQLSSGALAQYPVKKTRLVRTIKNVLPDGSLILVPDPNAAHLIWELVYTDLSTVDMQAIQAHFASCAGSFRAFTFIDPTENMLVWSSNLESAPWQSGSLIKIQPGLADPQGGIAGFTVTNVGQATAQIYQTLAVPANYQYCFSIYAKSAQPAQITLTRRGGPQVQTEMNFEVSADWNRVTSSGRLSDPGTEFTVAIQLAAGQQLGLYGPQLEPQVSPSRFRPTGSVGGVFQNAHWGVNQLTTVAEAPGLYATAFSIETAVQD